MAAKLADMPVEEFCNLNPGHQRPVITPMANRELLVPVDKAELFHSNLENNAQPLVTWQTYQLKQGEKLDTVAGKFGISLQRLQEVNGLTAGKRIQVGQMLLVPMEGDDTTTNLDETYNSAEFKAPADDYHGRVSYRVKSGDTLRIHRASLQDVAGTDPAMEWSARHHAAHGPTPDDLAGSAAPSAPRAADATHPVCGPRESRGLLPSYRRQRTVCV
jgi:membrane-bound lytic murein transglycosylase D